ncbi:SH3 domain-containing protein 2-like isoform X2 [Cynara cardunculus var. scolymus]|uniref:SH3 domain-containing protein 2-like isoform X2 n=1 Tax=Cynara cardunculus var. scolymus TaxID=59895 RepID=UPI000D6233AF|nr:SH3 domain-containing protein 2-like isoform X2 [Cynara cardunculus var. scolymus]
METIRKQAVKLREQVAKQHFGGGADGGLDDVADEAEVVLHQKLERLYISTRVAKQFQRDIVRGVEGYIVSGSKLVEIGNKLSEDSKKYGIESGGMLSRAAVNFSRARAQMEKEQGNLLKFFGTQVAEPLRAMVMGAPLVDARHLAQGYDRMRQEAESQAVEVSKRQARVRDGMGNSDHFMKLEAAESRLQHSKSNMLTLGKQAASAMAAVEAEQQKMTLQRLISMIESERDYHQRVLQILDHLEGEMVSERQPIEATPPVVEPSAPPPYKEVKRMFASPVQNGSDDDVNYFLGEVMFSYYGESAVELSLSVGDFVVVRKVCSDGWAEGECKGKAGWFPAAYIQTRQHVLATKIF